MSFQRRSHRRDADAGTCLVVEDSKFDQEKIKRILSRSFRELDVEIADTLEEARNTVENGPIKLILLDNNLPDGQGANFAVELSENPQYADIPIVIVSDWPTPFMFHKAELAGVLHVVNKADFGARFIHSALKH